MFRKKPFYGAEIQPACEYCEHGRRAADPRMILCCKCGVWAYMVQVNLMALLVMRRRRHRD